ncbi:hypothetical protein HB364_12990 [Pseudoflavitalea sp. X16]|uniref:hypothetical protein n=1 Tax=Paraflavitalea devenefica TaxID=2716334 RepID=UPI001422B8EE|nr:hypothetical protein [Paraflavitalea devenefica]NII26004.1 hypothetical protein [Paraflavitalea devenefica]
MARYDTIPPVTGTIGPICIYKMYGRYFLRSRSSLTGDRVKKDPAFRKTMQYAALLAKASRIGSAVYALVPAERKEHALYRKLTGEAMTWLKYQWKEEDIIAYLAKQYTGKEIPAQEPAVTILKAPHRRRSRRIRRTILDLLETKPAKKLSHHLLDWRDRDRAYRRRYNETIATYPWGEYVMT